MSRMEQESVRRKPRAGDYAALLGRTKWLILTVVSLAVLLAYLATSQLPRIQEAALTLDLDRQNTGVSDSFIATQMQLIQSDVVLGPAAAKFGLDSRKVGQDLRLQRPDKTSLVRIIYRSTDLKRAAAVATAVADSYLAFQHQGQPQRTATNDMDTLRLRVEASEAALRHLQSVSPGLAAGAGQRESYARAVAEHATRQAAYDALKGGSVTALLASPEGESARRILDRRNEAQTKFNDLKQVFGENHPDYRRAEAELRELDNEFNAACQRALQNASAQLKAAIQQEADRKAGISRTRPAAGPDPSAYEAMKAKVDADRALYESALRKPAEPQNSAIRIVEPVNVSPEKNAQLRNCVLASLVGLPLAALILLAGPKPLRLRSCHDVRAVTATPIAGVLPVVRSSGPLPYLLRTKHPDFHELPYAEGVEGLREFLIAGGYVNAGCVLLVASPQPREGRSSVALNLAVSLTYRGKKTLLVDGDSRQPALHTVLSLGRLQANSVSPWRERIVKLADHPLLWVLAGGGVEATLAEIRQNAAAEFDAIVVDSPAFLENPEAVDLVANATAVVIVVRQNMTRDDALLGILSYLRRLQANIAGVVVNCAQDRVAAGQFSPYASKT